MMQNQKITNFLLVLLAAIFITLVGPNIITTSGLPFIAPIALVPLFILYRRLSSIKAMVGYSALFGALFSLFSNYWLYFFQDMRLFTLLGAALGVSLTTAIGTIPLYFLTKQQQRYRPFLIAAGWALFEYSRTIGFLAFPWGLIAYSFHQYPIFNQIIDITGLTALSFIIALYNAIITDFLTQYSNKKIIKVHLFITALLTLSILIYGHYQLNLKKQPSKEVVLLLAQQNDNAWNGSLFQSHQDAVSSLLNRELKPDLIVSGESVLESKYNYSYAGSWPNVILIADYVASIGIPQLIGAPVKGTWGFYNGTILTDAMGEITASYGKQHLVPLAEGMPLMETPFVHQFFYRHRLYTGWERGKDNTIFTLPLADGQHLKFSSPICFEDAFPSLNRKAVLQGSEIFINQTNDSWSQTEVALAQHLVAAKFRSIENRRVMVRAANSGSTVVISPKGYITHQLTGFTQGALLVKVAIDSPSLTFYSRHGDWFVAALIILISYYFVASYQRKKFY